MIDDSRHVHAFINKKYVFLCMAIFNQAIEDIKINSIPRPMKNEAWRWLIYEGYVFITDTIGIDVPPERYIFMLESIANENKKQGKKERVYEKLQLEEDLQSFELMGVGDQSEYLKLLESVRNNINKTGNNGKISRSEKEVNHAI